MWMKISTVDSDKKIIFLPSAYKFLKSEINISFGSRHIKANLNYYHNNNSRVETLTDKTVKVKISSGLQKKLLIPVSPIYQFKITKPNLKIGPVIAFLLGDYEFKSDYMKKYNDRLSIYNQIGGLIFVFSPQTIDFENNYITGLYYNPDYKEWKSGNFPFPSFIYRRNFSTASPEILKKLKNNTGNNLFNTYRFSKMELYNLLSNNEELKEYIPPTKKIDNFNQLYNFLKNHGNSILKPVRSSRGRGIYIIKKQDKKYKLIVYSRSAILDKVELEETLEKHYIFSNNFLAQKYIELYKVDNSIFDFRIVMQKVTSEKWQCTGIEVRKAKEGRHLTNISRGGTALKFTDITEKVFSSKEESELMKYKILKLSEKFCSLMDSTKDNYHEFGLDIALDKNKKIWFLEANVLPAFEGFKKINYNNYLTIKQNPLIYAVYKTGFEINKNYF